MPEQTDRGPAAPGGDLAPTVISSARPSSAPLPPGTVLAGRYRVVRLLGRGAMGDVHAADDLRLGQPVAVKLLPESLARDADRVSRFLDEIRLARRVAHPNICRVHDLGEGEGRLFLSMELIEGEDLASLLAREGRIEPARAASIARQICDGLAAAHDRGILHRDLKPSNVMVDRQGVVHLTDFGLAVAAEAVHGPRSREGTPGYMAPEQLEGRSATVASDLYALGLVLYELFTGQPARQGASLAELMTESASAPATPSSRAAGLDPGVDRVVLRCLEVDPARRPASARAVAEALPGSEAPGPAHDAAQRRSDRILAFREELAEAVRDGAIRIEDDQWTSLERYHAAVLRDLLERFDVDVGERSKMLSLAMRGLSTLGATALAASAFYFLHSIWGSLGTGLQAALLVAMPAGAAVLLDVTARRERRRRHFTTMAAFLCAGCFVAGTSIAAGMGNAPVRPFHLLAWAALPILLAYAYRVPLALGFGAVLAAVSPWALVLSALGLDWGAGIFQRPEGVIPGGLLLLLASARLAHPSPGFASAYRVPGLVLVLLPLVMCANDPLFSGLPWSGQTVQALYLLGGMAVTAGIAACGVAVRRREVVHLGILALAALLLSAMIHWGWDAVPRWLFFFLVGAATLAILALVRRLHAAASRPPGARP